MISGFVIPYSIKNGPINVSAKKFVISRFFRLYPVYWVSVIMSFIFVNHSSIKNSLVNLTMLQQFVGIPNAAGVYWTLQIELVFYFLILLLLIFKKNNNVRTLFLLSMFFLILSLFMSGIRFYLDKKIPIAITLGLSIMFAGSYLRNVILDNDKISKKYFIYFLSAWFCLIPIISYLGYNKEMGYHENWIKYTITYLSGVLIFLAICKIKATSNFSEFLGKISYSVYLFHTIFIFIIFEKLKIYINPYINSLIIFLIVILYSTMMYFFVEKPGVSLGKKISNKI